MDSKPYDLSDSLSSVSHISLDISEPDSPESSSSLLFRDGEWQLLLDKDDMNDQSFNPKRALAPCLYQVIFPNELQQISI